jgi:hypothetical protein
MYRKPPRSILYQGDVVTEFAYPVLSNLTFRERDFVSQLRIKTGPLIIVSHDCDLELYNNVPKRVAVQLCPLAAIPKQLKFDAEALERVKTNRVVPETPEFLNLFFFDAATSDGIFKEDMVADISLIHSFPSSPNLLDQLLAAKKLELQDEYRILLQDKLMYQYGRENLRPAKPSSAN